MNRRPRKLKKRLEMPFKRRIPKRLKGVPATFYDYILKQSGRPFYSMHDQRESSKSLLRMIRDLPL